MTEERLVELVLSVVIPIDEVDGLSETAEVVRLSVVVMLVAMSVVVAILTAVSEKHK